MKFKLLTLILVLFISTVYAQQTEKGIVKWLPFEDTFEKFKQNQKPIFILLHNPKSKQSDSFMNTTLSNPEVTNYINVLFYPTIISDTTVREITFFDGTKYQKTNKAFHDLAHHLFGDTLAFPSFLIFGKDAQGRVFNGNLSRDSIFPALIYYAEDMPKSTTYEEFEKYYYQTYPPGKEQTITRVLVKWKTFDELDSLMKVRPKKIFLDVYNNYKISATMQRLKTYNNPVIANYLNKHFYPVTINAFEKNKIEFLNQTFINENLAHQYHQLPIALLSGQMTFPAFLVLNEQQQIVAIQQLYFTPETFEPFIQYYGSDGYKNLSQQEFLKTFKTSLPKQ